MLQKRSFARRENCSITMISPTKGMEVILVILDKPA